MNTSSLLYQVKLFSLSHCRDERNHHFFPPKIRNGAFTHNNCRDTGENTHTGKGLQYSVIILVLVSKRFRVIFYGKHCELELNPPFERNLSVACKNSLNLILD